MFIESLLQKYPKQFKFILAILLIYTLVHIAYSGIYRPFFYASITAYVQEMENVRYAAENRHIDPDAIHSYAHYGPTFFLINYPLRHFTDEQLNWIVLYANYVFLLVSFLICMKHFALSNVRSNKLLYGLLFFILWFNFSPFFRVTAIRCVEIFEFFLICLAFHAFQTKRRVLCAICLSMAALTKMLPAVFLFYMFFKDRKIFFYSIISCVLILLAGQLVYGPVVGFSYPLHLLTRATGGYADGFYENTSLKALIWRIFSGFHWEELIFVVKEKYVAWAQVISSLFQIAGIALLALVSFSRYRHEDKDKTSLEFALVSITMILLSPFANYVYAMLTFFAYAVGFYFIVVKQFRVSRADIAMYVISYLLVGNFFPLILVKFIPWHIINNFLGNTVLPKGVGSGADYLFYWQGYCFPTYGYILLFVFTVSLLKKAGFLKISFRTEE